MPAVDPLKRQRLEAAGWKIGSVAEFLELSPEEAAVVESNLDDHVIASNNLAEIYQKGGNSSNKSITLPKKDSRVVLDF